MTIITSQHFLDDEIIAQKISARDFTVFVSPEFEVNGIAYRVLLDGNHSFAAALEAGVEPEIIEQSATDNDAIGLLDAGDIETFLEVVYMDGEYVNALTRKTVW